MNYSTKSIVVAIILAMGSSIEARLNGSDRKLSFQIWPSISLCKQVDVQAGYMELKYETQSANWLEAFFRLVINQESDLHVGLCDDICSTDFCSARATRDLPLNTFALVDHDKDGKNECYCFIQQVEPGEKLQSECDVGLKKSPEGECVEACANPFGNPCGPGGKCTDIPTGVHCEFQFP